MPPSRSFCLTEHHDAEEDGEQGGIRTCRCLAPLPIENLLDSDLLCFT